MIKDLYEFEGRRYIKISQKSYITTDYSKSEALELLDIEDLSIKKAYKDVVGEPVGAIDVQFNIKERFV